MVKINTKPDYDKLNELYQIALNNNRLLVLLMNFTTDKWKA
jgi:hypothetical protein